MRTTKKIISSLLAVCMLASTSAFSSFAAVNDSNEVGANNYVTVCEAIDNEYTYTNGDLGANYTPERTTFKVWSPTATVVKLNRYATGSDSEAGAQKLGTIDMEKLMDGDKWTGVWTVTVDGDIKNTYYTYSITSTRPIGSGQQTVETQDVYSVATGVNGKRSMVCDLDSTDPEGWESDTHKSPAKSTQSSVWELHVKDFSYDKKSGVSEKNRGKFTAFTETGTKLEGTDLSTCIDYLKELGVNTVQLNPFYDFHTVNEAGSDDQFNWGYDPQNYNVPEGSYSTNPYDGNVRIKECKQMIQALHNAGIAVVMDVVYNHTYSNSSSDSCFQATVPDYYYRLRTNGQFSNGSGCGNEVATERAMVRDYIVQSTLYWVNEYHVDGFRFDLMGLMDVETMNEIRAQLDLVDPTLTMWGEGWTGGSSYHASNTCTGAKFVAATQANSSQLNERVAYFNDKIRDGVKGSVFDINDKGFIAGTRSYAKDIRGGVRANSNAKNGWLALAPSQAVTYAACHDNATLYDQITASAALGEYGERHDLGVKMNKMAGAIIYTSQGVSFTLAGEEMCRTKFGDTNSYKSAPTINMINWQNIVDYADVVSYYRGLMQIKSAFSPLTAMDKSYDSAFTFNGATLAVESNQVAYTIANDQAGEWNKMAVIHNSDSKEVTVTLADTSTTEWVIIANDKEAGLDNLGEVSGSTFTVPAYSSLIAVDKEGFENAALASNTGKVVVKFESANGTELADPVVIKGSVGSSYQTTPSTGISDVYILDTVDGNESGKFTADTQTITYKYKDYVPASIDENGDIDGDGKIKISDVTELQKYLANLVEVNDAKAVNYDFNYDGKVDIKDATMLQKFIAEIPVSSGEVVVNYYYTDSKGNQGNLTDSVTIKGRVGSDFTTNEYKVMGYGIDTTKYPANASGKIPFGETLEVNYYYIASSLDVKLHLKHNGSLTWEPSLWIWGADLNGKDSGNYSGGTWPGVNAKDTDGDGWFDYDFTYAGAGSYNVIVSNAGATQTQDYKGFVDNEMWIVIDDSKVSGGSFLTFYTENPDTNPNAPIATQLY